MQKKTHHTITKHNSNDLHLSFEITLDILTQQILHQNPKDLQ